jgi:hypothetical protein
MFLLPSWAWAADLEVGGLGYPDLESALAAAQSGDRLLLHGPEWRGSYIPQTSLTLEPWPNEAVTLYVDGSAGEGSPDEDGFFRVQSGNLVVRGFTLDGGGAYRIARLTNNYALDFEQCVLVGGERSGTGGAVMVEAGVLRLDGSILQGNHADRGGAVAVNSSGSLIAVGTRFEGNTADELGGAIWGDGGVILEDSVLVGNTALEGGALYQNGTTVITGSTLCANVADDEGGAIVAHNNSYAYYSVFFGNLAASGGAGAIIGSTATWWNNDFVANEASLTGSVLHVEGATASVWNSIITDHPVAGDLFSTAGGTVQLESSLAWNNTASIGTFTVIQGDPLFVNLVPTDCEASDLHLQPGSPAIGAGNVAYDDDLGAFPCGGTELLGDGVDGDCDGLELCYQDLDGDTYGTAVQLLDATLDCTGPGVSPVSTDCDDDDASVHPEGIELPGDGLDSDCDEQDLCYADADTDGFGAGDPDQLGPVGCGGLALQGGDCDDDDPSIHPDADDICDTIDNDCDLLLDEGAFGPTWYADTDGDGFGDPLVSSPACAQPPETSPTGDDCDDQDPLRYPGAPERCNALDDDCDGADDEDLALGTSWSDADGDGYGGGEPSEDCVPEGSALQGGDCDDQQALAYPGAPETCDGFDNDCDGAVDPGCEDQSTSLPGVVGCSCSGQGARPSGAWWMLGLLGKLYTGAARRRATGEGRRSGAAAGAGLHERRA